MILDAFRDKHKDCKLCPHCMSEKKVFGHGNSNAEVCVIGEGPGEEEAERGRPFLGLSGQLLDKILAGVNIKREECYFTNTVVCRTSKDNRTPSTSEVHNCYPRLLEELSILKPKVCLLVGSSALRCIFGNEYRISDSHGKWLTTLGEPCYFYYPIYHPAYILHSSTHEEAKAKKEEVWKDIIKFKTDLETFTNLDL